MAASLAVVGEFFAGGAVETGVAAATADATTAALVTAGATGTEAAAAGSALGTSIAATEGGTAAVTAAATAGGGTGLGDVLGKIGTQVATGVGTAVASSMLMPKAKLPPTPKIAPVTAMPDPLAEQDAARKSIIEQTARRGRASTVLTDTASGGKLGGG